MLSTLAVVGSKRMTPWIFRSNTKNADRKVLRKHLWVWRGPGDVVGFTETKLAGGAASGSTPARCQCLNKKKKNSHCRGLERGPCPLLKFLGDKDKGFWTGNFTTGAKFVRGIANCGRKPEHPDRRHTWTGKTCSVHTDRPQLRFEPPHHCATLTWFKVDLIIQPDAVQGAGGWTPSGRSGFLFLLKCRHH